LTDVEPARSSHIERRSRPAASALPSTSSRNTGRIFSAASSLRPDAEPPYERALAIRETPKNRVLAHERTQRLKYWPTIMFGPLFITPSSA
jgi:hypothetical protein